MASLDPSGAALVEHIKRSVLQAKHTLGQSLYKWQNSPSPSRWGWDKDYGFRFHTGHPYHQWRLHVKNYWNVDVILVVLGNANVSSPNYFALLFAVQLLRRLDHVHSKMSCSIFLNACAECSYMKWTSNYIIQQILLHNFTENKNITQKYSKYHENIMKKRRHFEIRGGHLENDQNLNGQRYFLIK